MNTKTTVQINETRQPALTRAVVRQIGGRESLADVARHGAVGGYCGFTYYADTVAFAVRNRADIMERLKADAEDFGCVGVISMLAGFNCLKGMSQEEIAEGLYNPRSENRTAVYNALAWYAAEEIARELNPDC